MKKMKRFKQSVSDSQNKGHLTFYPCLLNGRSIPGHIGTITEVSQGSDNSWDIKALVISPNSYVKRSEFEGKLY